MNNQAIIEDQKKEAIKLQENYEDQYWLKKYGVTTEELKNTKDNVGIYSKIVEANFKNNSYNF